MSRPHSVHHSLAGGNPERIEELSPRLPAESPPGVFHGSGPGNDGEGPPLFSYLIESAPSVFILSLFMQPLQPFGLLRIRLGPFHPGHGPLHVQQIHGVR